MVYLRLRESLLQIATPTAPRDARKFEEEVGSPMMKARSLGFYN